MFVTSLVPFSISTFDEKVILEAEMPHAWFSQLFPEHVTLLTFVLQFMKLILFCFIIVNRRVPKLLDLNSHLVI